MWGGLAFPWEEPTWRPASQETPGFQGTANPPATSYSARACAGWPRPALGWRDTLVPMVEATHKQVKIELEMNQNEDGNWVARCSLEWPDGITEHFAGKYAIATERSAHASALEQVRQYIDRRESVQKDV